MLADAAPAGGQEMQVSADASADGGGGGAAVVGAEDTLDPPGGSVHTAQKAGDECSAGASAAAAAAAAPSEPMTLSSEPLQLSPEAVASAKSLAAPPAQLGLPSLPVVEPAVKVAVVVCFRIQKLQRREQELSQFVPHMTRLLGGLQALGRVAKWHIFVVQQQGSQDEDGIKFNRGKLLNIGFVAAIKAGFNSFIFHDVDLLPSDDLAAYYGQYPHRPVHIASCWHQRGYTENEDYFGGVVSFNATQFRQINGYPNNFWGWGGEDEVLMDRIKMKKVQPAKVTKGSLLDIESNDHGADTKDMQGKLDWLRKNKEWKCDDRRERRQVDKDGGYATNGVSPKRRFDESPWLQFTRECQRF
jgi:hypothetical protein